MKNILIIFVSLASISALATQFKLSTFNSNIEGIWELDNFLCYSSSKQDKLLETWVTVATSSSLELRIDKKMVTITGNSTNCFSESYNYELSKINSIKNTLNYKLLTKEPRYCSVELNYFDGINVDLVTRYSFDLSLISKKLENKFFNKLDSKTLAIELPFDVTGSELGLCGANCKCYGVFLKD